MKLPEIGERVTVAIDFGFEKFHRGTVTAVAPDALYDAAAFSVHFEQPNLIDGENMHLWSFDPSSRRRRRLVPRVGGTGGGGVEGGRGVGVKLPGAVTAAYGGRIRVGKAISQGHGLIAVHFESYTGDPNDQGTWTDLAECGEDVTWVRGIPGPGPTAQALLAAKALT